MRGFPSGRKTGLREQTGKDDQIGAPGEKPGVPPEPFSTAPPRLFWFEKRRGGIILSRFFAPTKKWGVHIQDTIKFYCNWSGIRIPQSISDLTVRKIQPPWTRGLNRPPFLSVGTGIATGALRFLLRKFQLRQ